MDEDELNMQMRKFLKEVGVTSQREIEKAIAAAKKTGGKVRLRTHLTSPDVPLDHVVEREIDLG
jgi:hypothetical protein